MDDKRSRKQIIFFLRQLLVLNVMFPLFVTMMVVFFFMLGMSSSFLLGSTLLLLMGYNILIARYGFVLWRDLDRKEDERGSKSG